MIVDPFQSKEYPAQVYIDMFKIYIQGKSKRKLHASHISLLFIITTDIH